MKPFAAAGLGSCSTSHGPGTALGPLKLASPMELQVSTTHLSVAAGNCHWDSQALQQLFFGFSNILFIYSWEIQKERGRDIGRGRSRLHSGAWCGTQSQVSRITPWAKAGTEPLSHPGIPKGENSLIRVHLKCVVSERYVHWNINQDSLQISVGVSYHWVSFNFLF